jgi:hypothetical protein
MHGSQPGNELSAEASLFIPSACFPFSQRPENEASEHLILDERPLIAERHAISPAKSNIGPKSCPDRK